MDTTTKKTAATGDIIMHVSNFLRGVFPMRMPLLHPTLDTEPMTPESTLKRGKSFTRKGVTLRPPSCDYLSERTCMELGSCPRNRLGNPLDYGSKSPAIETHFLVKTMTFDPFTFQNEEGKNLVEDNDAHDILYIFVLDAKGNLFIAPEELNDMDNVGTFNKKQKPTERLKGVIHHSSFSNGKSVQISGQLAMSDGILIITPESGHYKPTKQELNRLIKFFKEKGMMYQSAENIDIRDFYISAQLTPRVKKTQMFAKVAATLCGETPPNWKPSLRDALLGLAHFRCNGRKR